MHAQLCVRTSVFISLMHIPGGGIVGSYGKCMLNHWRNCQIVFQSSCAGYIPTSSIWGLHRDTRSKTLIASKFFLTLSKLWLPLDPSPVRCSNSKQKRKFPSLLKFRPSTIYNHQISPAVPQGLSSPCGCALKGPRYSSYLACILFLVLLARIQAPSGKRLYLPYLTPPPFCPQPLKEELACRVQEILVDWLSPSCPPREALFGWIQNCVID